MSKPPLTQEQMNNFEGLFKELITHTTNETQDSWAKEGEFVWTGHNVKILPDGIENKLPAKQADKLVTEANKNGILFV